MLSLGDKIIVVGDDPFIKQYHSEVGTIIRVRNKHETEFPYDVTFDTLRNEMFTEDEVIALVTTADLQTHYSVD